MNTSVFNMPSLESESQPSQASSMDSDDVVKANLDAPEKLNCSTDLFSDHSDRSENLSTPEHKTNDDPTEPMPIKGLFDIDRECDDKLVNIPLFFLNLEFSIHQLQLMPIIPSIHFKFCVIRLSVHRKR